MGRLEFWHPVLESRALGRSQPQHVQLAGRQLALFRGEGWQPAAVEDRCAHRRMKLSVGTVRAGRITCPYHGWSFDAEGRGESPSAPKLHACVTSYECAEMAGAIWVKGRGAPQEMPVLEMPVLEMPGWHFVGPVFNCVRAPLELVIDNFSEIEHTVTAHPHFGLDEARASEAEVRMESDAESVAVRNRGPAKMLPLDTRVAVAMRRGDLFHSDYTFRFDPPRSSVTHRWTDPQTSRERRLKYHVFHYFVPEDEQVTKIVTFGFLKIGWPVFRHLGPQLGWLFRRRLRQTVDEDAFLLENLADQSPSLEGMKLSRFDPILRLTRERLERIYDGKPAGVRGADLADAP